LHVEADGRGPQHAEGDAALLEGPARGEAVERPSRERERDVRRLPKRATVPRAQLVVACAPDVRQLVLGLARHPLRGDPAVYLVGGGEAADVGTVAGAQVEDDAARAARARERCGHRSRDDEEEKGGALPRPHLATVKESVLLKPPRLSAIESP